MKKKKYKGKEIFQIVFFSLIAEMNLVALNLINIFFIGRFLGVEGVAAYEVVMPCPMIISAVVALGYNGVQAVCAKDYGKGDFKTFVKHRNAGYTWMIIVMVSITVLLAVLRNPVLDFLGANEGSASLAKLSRDCYSIFLCCIIPQSLFSLAGCFLFFEEKQTLLVANCIFYGCTIGGNIIVATMHPSMIAFMMVNTVGVFFADAYVAVLCLSRKNSLASFTAWNMRVSDVKEIVFTGLPDFMEYGFAGILYLLENLYLLSRFSESVMGGMSVFEAIDNLPEIICVGFSFLVTSVLGMKVGGLASASSATERYKKAEELERTAKRITQGGICGGLVVTIGLVLTARFFVDLILMKGDTLATNSAVWFTISCALRFVFYLLNTELVCYYKIVGAFIPAYIVFFAEALCFPLVSKILLGEFFGVKGFCMGGAVAEIAVFVLNLCIIRWTEGHFPRKISDFRMNRYLCHTTQKLQKKSKSEGGQS